MRKSEGTLIYLTICNIICREWAREKSSLDNFLGGEKKIITMKNRNYGKSWKAGWNNPSVTGDKPTTSGVSCHQNCLKWKYLVKPSQVTNCHYAWPRLIATTILSSPNTSRYQAQRKELTCRLTYSDMTLVRFRP